ESIDFPNNLQSIGQFAFENTPALESISFGNNIDLIEDAAFRSSGLTELKIEGNGNTHIGVQAFVLNSSLTTVVIGDGVRSLDTQVFNTCAELRYVSLGQGLERIGAHAFVNTHLWRQFAPPRAVCESCAECEKEDLVGGVCLRCLTCPECAQIEEDYYANMKNVFVVDNWVVGSNFRRLRYPPPPPECPIHFCQDPLTCSRENPCDALDCSDTAASRCPYCGPVVLEYVQPQLIDIDLADHQNTTPSGQPIPIVGIADFGFSGAFAMRSIVMPDSIRHIGEQSFLWTEFLKSVHFSKNIQTINQYAFWGTFNLSEIYTPGTPTFETLNAADIKRIGTGAFGGILERRDQDRIVISRTVTSALWENVAHNQTTPFGVVYAGRWAVGYIPNLEVEVFEEIMNIHLREDTIGISDFAFAGIETDEYRIINELILNESLKYIGEFAFARTTLNIFVLPSSVEELGRGAFFRNQWLTTVDLTGNSIITEIKQDTFSFNSALTSIRIPANIIHIGDYAFRDCSNLHTLTFHHNSALQTIGDRAFIGNNALSEISLPSTVRSIGLEAFRDSSGLEIVFIDPEGDLLSIGAGAFKGTMLHYIGCEDAYFDRLVELALPPDQISEAVFDSILPSGLTFIGDEAFMGTLLTSIYIPSGVKRLGDRVFSGVSTLIYIHLNDGLEVIGDFAFYSAIRLKHIEVPQTLLVIGAHAFRNATGLLSITLPKTVMAIGEHAFFQTNNYFVIYVEGLEERPYTWDLIWNSSNRQVNWAQ
ncbi:MAG: leucine-rich repeat domain-containing protein, partial [Firmicutes bacterium]|nr:leucine-rich repeat domain-containing protein [Bacillota bacterium]